MSFRSILVHVDNSPAAEPRVAAAAALAMRFGASLTGVFLRSDLVPNFVVGDGVVALPAEAIERFIEERDAEIAKAEVAARALFDRAARDGRFPFHWLSLCGDNEHHLAMSARRHDLSILPASMRCFYGENRISAAQVGMMSGGPMLVLPQAGYPVTFGRKILVAWKESREAARALRDAWPFLASAEEVTFLIVDRHADSQLDEQMLRHLEANGCRTARLVVERDDDASTGELIGRHVDLAGADMLVLGLYGNSRLREFVLGGVSRKLLSAPPMPLLLSH